jgi:hypothetical protein
MAKQQLDCLELDFWYCLGLKLEGITVFKMLGIAVHPVTQHHISVDLILSNTTARTSELSFLVVYIQTFY